MNANLVLEFSENYQTWQLLVRTIYKKVMPKLKSSTYRPYTQVANRRATLIDSYCTQTSSYVLELKIN